MEESSGPQGHLHLQPQEPPTAEDMYKVTSRIVLALRSPSGFSLEIRGGWGSSDGRWGMGKWGLPHPPEMKRAWKVTLVPKLQPPIGWKGWGGRVSARYLEGYCFLGIFTF